MLKAVQTIVTKDIKMTDHKKAASYGFRFNALNGKVFYHGPSSKPQRTVLGQSFHLTNFRSGKMISLSTQRQEFHVLDSLLAAQIYLQCKECLNLFHI